MLITRYSSLFNIAVQEAKQSRCGYKHGAVLFSKKNKIIGKGCNSDDRNYYKKGLYPSIHAEIDCIKRSFLDKPRKRCRKRLKIMVVRVNKSGDVISSKPCSSCVKHLLRYPMIKDIIYSTKLGKLKIMKLSKVNMNDTGYSYGVVLSYYKVNKDKCKNSIIKLRLLLNTNSPEHRDKLKKVF